MKTLKQQLQEIFKINFPSISEQSRKNITEHIIEIWKEHLEQKRQELAPKNIQSWKKQERLIAITELLEELEQ